ncbi:Zinc ABC transporter, inner membrane permease protein ZnuB [Exiguobacterium sp. 8H]|uniref:metal ABC transporter permease n=1 Tax=unclassified Exiguobacterium TaxID=2644629 RepID=UPI0012F24238|nr:MULTISPECIES: metal ABC transporter permease [unclassified Exiguobacterium]VXB32422.1 Zinc ABC transporter, inner membrane permease protein ZnuB [Exiguobacterium sp. 8H]VXB33912.1 ABC-3 protein [Exiguobacterium sp. 8A]
MITDLWTYSFLRYAFIAALVIGFTAPLIGSFIVVRRMSLIADALSHMTLAGISFSLFLGQYIALFADLNPLYMGTLISVLAALGLNWLRGKYVHFQELSIPIMMSAGMGLSAIFISLSRGFSVDLSTLLFGSISAVSQSDITLIVSVAVLTLFVILIFYKQLLFLSFDEEQAKVSGLPSTMLHLLFMFIVALVIAVSMRIVGTLLVSSLITLPVAAALRFTSSFKQTIMWSIIFGEVATIGGLVLAYDLDLAPGGVIVLIAVGILAAVMALEKVMSFKKKEVQHE